MDKIIKKRIRQFQKTLSGIDASDEVITFLFTQYSDPNYIIGFHKTHAIANSSSYFQNRVI